MTLTDSAGLALTGATPDARDHYIAGLRGLQTFTGDPVGAADAAIEAAPGFVMAHVLKGWLYGLSTEAAALRVTAEIHEAVSGLPAADGERAHVAALGALVSGRWHEAGRLLAERTRAEPRDALGLQAGHQIDFFTGNAPMLRDRIAAALPAWDRSMPGYHALLGMHAFGLEETGDYAAAERTGRDAVELEPRDGWAQHAVAHVMEMQCRQRDGIAWMRASPETWSTGSFLQVHNWWHLGLFHYDLGEIDEVLALYDGPVYGDRSTLALNMVDASALLWRLHIGGHDTGERWQALAQNWAPLAGSGNYAFNDMHAMMAFVGAGDTASAARLLEAQRAAMAGEGDNAGFTRDIGHPATQAVLAFGEGDFGRVVDLLAPIRAIAHRFGGSHAQRDVIDLTLIEAAIRAGRGGAARTLTTERLARREASPLSRLFAQRSAALFPSPES